MNWNNISVTDLAAVIISLCALALSIVQGLDTVKSNKIAVRPNVDVSFLAVRGSSQPHGFKITNSGVGPALIKEISFYVDGQKITASKFEIWKEIFEKIGWEGAVNFDDFHIVHLPQDYYVQPGQTEYLLKLLPADGENKRELTTEEWAKLNRLSIEVQYLSMHDERFSIRYTPANDDPYVRNHCH